MDQFLKSLIQRLVAVKIWLVLLIDSMVAGIGFLAAYLLRQDFDPFLSETYAPLWPTIIGIVAVQLIVFYFSGLYRGIWRFSSTHDLFRIVVAATLGVAGGALIAFFINRLEGIPRTVFIIDWLILIVGLGGIRFSYRLLRDFLQPGSEKKAIIIGAGRAGEQLFREFKNSSTLNTSIVGFLDDEPALKGKYLHGVKIYGGISDLNRAVSETEAGEILIAIPGIKNQKIREIVNKSAELGISVKRLPDLTSFVKGQVTANQLKAVSPADLLGRAPVELNRIAMAEMLSDRRVMVTGAGGSIGCELVRQIIEFKPASLVLLDMTELFLYEAEQELSELAPQLPAKFIIADVRSLTAVEKIMKENRPEVVFHAAAYKHVPLMEENPWQAVENNIGGTQNVAGAAGKYGVDKFILISTDKAVNPTNIMGVTKRICEMVCTELQTLHQNTRYIAVRFGNVLGSTGSVIPLFKKQIEAGGPVTVTHPDVRRYFMSIPEAVQLVMQAAAMGEGGEVFVLEMGDPVRITDLAREMIALSGFIPEKEIQIIFTGLRPGEKLYEELLTDAESTLATSHPGVRIAKLSKNHEDFSENLKYLLKEGAHTSRTDLMKRLEKLVPEYQVAVLKNREKLRLIQSG